MFKKIFFLLFTITIFLFINKQAFASNFFDTTEGIATSTLQNACTAQLPAGYQNYESNLSVKLGNLDADLVNATVYITLFSGSWQDYNIINYSNISIGGDSSFNETVNPNSPINGGNFVKLNWVLSGVTASSGAEIDFNAGIGNQGRNNCIFVLQDATSTYKDSLGGGDDTQHFTNGGYFIFSISSLNISFPQKNYNDVDFDNWTVDASTFNTSTAQIGVIYHNLQDQTVVYSDFSPVTLTSSTQIFQIQKSVYLSPGDYQATPEIIYNSSTNEIEYGNIIYFTINSGLSSSSNCGSPPNPFFSFISTPPFFQFGSLIDNLNYTFCLLFTPSSDQMNTIQNNFSNIQTSISNKVPFGYFTQIKNILSSTSTITTSTLVLTSSTIGYFSIIFDPFYIIFSTLLWILLLFWALHRFTHYDY